MPPASDTALYSYCVYEQVEFEELGFSAEVPLAETGVPNLAKKLVSVATLASTKSKSKTILNKCSGMLESGTLTLVRWTRVCVRLAELFVFRQ